MLKSVFVRNIESGLLSFTVDDIARVFRMKIRYLHHILVCFISLLAVFWMRPILLYALFICVIFICSWLIGLLMYLQFSQVPVTADDAASLINNKHSLLHRTVMLNSFRGETEISSLSRGLSEVLEQLMQLIVRDCIAVWIDDITSDHDLIKQQLMTNMWTAVNRFSHHVGNFDKTMFLTRDVANVLMRHFRNIRCADCRREDHEAFHLHPCLRNAETEAEHLRLITETFISELLPSSFSTNSFVRNLLREIFTCKVLKPAVDLVCDPHYLNSKLHGWLTYKEHMVAKANRKYLYAATYEDFMEMIEQCEDIEQLKHIRYAVISELMQATFVKDQNHPRTQNINKSACSKRLNKVDMLNSRDLSRYINQLKRAKALCAKRMQYIGGSEYSCYVDCNEVPLQKKTIPFTSVLRSPDANQLFVRFLSRTDDTLLLKFFEAVEDMRHARCQRDVACDVYHAYIEPRSSPVRLQLNPKMIADMDQFIQGNEGVEAFWKAQEKIYQVLKEQFYPSFLLSDLFHSYTKRKSSDCGENYGDDWIVIPSWTETDDKADEHGRNIMSHLTAAKRMLDDVSGRLTALKKSSGGVKTGCELASKTCDADVAPGVLPHGDDYNELLSMQQKLEFHVSRTEMWLAHLGRWKAHVLQSDVREMESGKTVVCFAVVVDLEDSSSLSSSPSVASSSPQCRSSSDLPLAWVVLRQLQDFVTLHQQLLKIKGAELQFDVPDCLRSQKVQALMQCQQQMQRFLDRVLFDEVLARTDPVYVFCSPCRDLIVQTSTPTVSLPAVVEEKSLFSRFLRKASFVRTKSVGELSDGISDEVTADADSGVDSIMQPLYRLIFEVFELTGIFKWLPRTLVSLVQVTYGKSISRQVRDSVQWVCSEPMLVYYVQLFRDAYWPNGRLSAAAEPPTEMQKLHTRRQAKAALLRNIPETAKTLINEDNARRGAIKVFEAVQNVQLNKHLFYTVLELFMRQVFPTSREALS